MTDSAPILIVADDLTGANATAAGLARDGLRAVTVPSAIRVDVVAEFAARFDAVVVSTNSRHVPPAEAAELLLRVVRAGWPARLIANRIDSTLRGNLGATTAAVLAAVAEQSGRRAVALCSPSHPMAGRQTVAGTQLLHGMRLEDTELARDPRSPIRDSDIAARLQEQANLRIANVSIDDITGDPAELTHMLRRLLDDDVEVVVSDALTEEHLARVARAAVHAADPSMVWVSVDSGPGAQALARALEIHTTGTPAPLLAVSGSATELTRFQLARLCAVRDVIFVRPVLDNVVPDVDATAATLHSAIANAGSGQIVLLTSAMQTADLLEVDPVAAERIPRALVRSVRRVLEQQPVSGLYATGGDVAAALLAEVGASGLDVETEVVPLAVAGSLVSGPHSGLPVVTKGGLIGDEDTAVLCLDHLRHTAELRRRHVTSAQSRT